MVQIKLMTTINIERTKQNKTILIYFFFIPLLSDYYKVVYIEFFFHKYLVIRILKT